MDLISVVVPVFNKDECLKRCLDSVLSQSYEHFELLIVDDGSSDCSPQICDQYAKVDSRVKVFHKKNGGVSSARNLGIRNANGVWICFVDADDFVDKDYLQNFIEKKKKDTDLILQGFWYHDLWHNKITEVKFSPSKIYGNYNLVQLLENKKIVHNGFIWHRLFRRDIILQENAYFPEGISIAEDGWFFFKYLKNAHHFEFSDKPGYHYHAGSTNSLTFIAKKRDLSIEEWLVRNFTVLLRDFSVDENHKKKHYNFIKKYMWRFLCDGLIARTYLDKEDKDKTSSIIKDIVRQYEMDSVEHALPSVILIKTIILLPESNIKDFFAKLFLKYRTLETKILRHL